MAEDGIHSQAWPLASGPAHGLVYLVHGLGEHIGRYEWLARRLNAAGWHVAGHDHPGHGRSAGARGALARPDQLLAVLGAQLAQARAVHVEGRCVLLGHSMGGAVAARFVAEGLARSPAAWHRPVDGLVLSSPALDIGLSMFNRLLLALLPPLLPNLRLGNGLDPKWISRDAAVVQAYREDALVHAYVTPRLVRFLADAGAQALDCAPHWPTPTLLLWAGADRCVRPEGSARFAAAAPQARLQHQCFEGLAHEIFNEPEREAVLTRLLDWLPTL
jgi:alpha-beta hydrolase superfamily lysophospholipase